MTEGTITKWLIQEGQKIEIGMPLFEMETDKLNIEIISPASGTLLKIIRVEGDVVPITETIGVIGEPGEDISAFVPETIKVNKAEDVNEEGLGQREELTQSNPTKTSAKKRDASERIFITPRAKALAAEREIDIADIDGSGPDQLIIEKDVLAYVPSAPAVTAKATPLAAKLAAKKEINLEEVEGSGARGKIIKSDIEAAIATRLCKTVPGSRVGKVIPFVGMRKVIADRMMQSLHSMAQANHRMKVDMTEVIRFREQLKSDGVKVSYTDILTKIVAKALLDFQVVNSSLTDEGILMKDYVNIGLAVAVENGLIVPVVKDADLMTLQEISTVATELIDKAKKGNLSPNEYTGGTFTITNLGMFDIDEFTAVINPPESAILAVGKIDRVPVVVGESVVIRPIMMLSLTYDHRIIDGAPAAQFLQRVKQIMQNPYLLI